LALLVPVPDDEVLELDDVVLGVEVELDDELSAGLLLLLPESGAGFAASGLLSAFSALTPPERESLR